MMRYVCGHREDSALCAPVEECRLAAQCVARSLPNNPVRFRDFGLVVCETCTSLSPTPTCFIPPSNSFFCPTPTPAGHPLRVQVKTASTQKEGKKRSGLAFWPLGMTTLPNMHEYVMVGWEAVCSCWLRSQRERERRVEVLVNRQSCNNHPVNALHSREETLQKLSELKGILLLRLLCVVGWVVTFSLWFSSESLWVQFSQRDATFVSFFNDCPCLLLNFLHLHF